MEAAFLIDENITGDHLVRTIAGNGYLRALAVDSREICQRAQDIHGLTPVATCALGRTLTATAIMSAFLKGRNNSITVQIKGDGPLEGIVTVSDFEGNVRGYVGNPQVEDRFRADGKFDVGAVVGRTGRLNILKDLGLREPYIGFVDLVSGEIAEDFTQYFAYSEQVPSIVALGVLIGKDGRVEQAGGFLIQLLPDAPEDIIRFLEGKLGTLKPVTVSLSENRTPEQILEDILGEVGVTLLEKRPISYQCNCNRDKMTKNLIALGEKELRDILEEDGKAQLECHFCNNKYVFDNDELKKILEMAK